MYVQGYVEHENHIHMKDIFEKNLWRSKW